MANVGGVTVAKDVVGPLVLGGIGVAGANIASLEGLEVLEGAQLVSHGERWVEVGWRRRRCGEVWRER